MLFDYNKLHETRTRVILLRYYKYEQCFNIGSIYYILEITKCMQNGRRSVKCLIYRRKKLITFTSEKVIYIITLIPHEFKNKFLPFVRKLNIIFEKIQYKTSYVFHAAEL